MPEPQQEELTVDLPSEGQSVSVNVEPSTLNTEAEAEAEVENVEEHEDYSKKVKKRIDKLTKKVREAERQQQAAIDYAKNIQQENSALKTRVQSLDVGYVNEYSDRVTSQAESLEKDLETAIATNDTASQVELNKKMAQLAIEQERVRAAKQEQERINKQSQQQQQYQQQVAAQSPAQGQVPVRPDPKAEEWANRNDWFGQDEAMTFASFGIHKTLVEEEGFDTNSEEYYSEIDKRMKEAFPHKFGEGSQVVVSEGRRPQQAVASATRSSNSGRKTVRLSPSEVAIARKLGVSLDEYAKHKR
jgi:hypothetical protein|tara:strand:+ start:1945 stop:2850 length:906 start_codon:yes stop_codon:yes gene_type:complete